MQSILGGGDQSVCRFFHLCTPADVLWGGWGGGALPQWLMVLAGGSKTVVCVPRRQSHATCFLSLCTLSLNAFPSVPSQTNSPPSCMLSRHHRMSPHCWRSTSLLLNNGKALELLPHGMKNRVRDGLLVGLPVLSGFILIQDSAGTICSNEKTKWGFWLCLLLLKLEGEIFT